MTSLAGVPTVLVVEDDADLRRLLVEELEDFGMVARHAASAEEAWDQLELHLVDVVVSDLRLPGESGTDLLARTLRLEPRPSFVIVTAFGTVPQAVAALKAGADDFLTKPLDLDHLRTCLQRILEHRELRRKVRLYDQLIGEESFHGMVGRSGPMLRVFDQVVSLARAHGPVLVTGESGTGKELAARAIHAESRRRDGPFVAVNCAAVPGELLESEFFGHQQGAFTGASRARLGLFRDADGGTLLLDEISEMPFALQAKLLRVLQEAEVRPVGAGDSVPVDVRIIASTHRELEREVRAGRFREDLFFRLETFQLPLPPLRERGDDLELLAGRFLVRFNLELDRRVHGFSTATLRLLRRYRFPGNVRELQNAVERAVTFCRDDEIRVEHLPERVRGGGVGVETSSTTGSGHQGALRSLAEIEADYIRHVLDRLDGNKRRAARVLGISRRTLYRKLEESPARDATVAAAAPDNISE